MSDDAIPSDSSARTANDRRMFGHLRNIRSACQYLQGRIADALKESAALSPKQRKERIAQVLDRPLLHRVDRTMEAALAAVQEIFAADPAEFEWSSDDVTSISLLWAQVQESLAAALDASDSADQHFKPAQDSLDRIVYLCASLTLSPRVNDALAHLRIGQPLDIEFQFGDEFPADPDLRKRLTLELAQESAVLKGGVVDPDQGLVYKVAPDRRGQLMSLWWLLGFLLLGLVLPFALATAGKLLPGWPFKLSDLTFLLPNYIVILLGSGAHYAVAGLKAARQQTRPSFQDLNDWVLWIHVHQTPILKGIAYVWLGYVLLSFGIPGLNWTSAFFAGYSIDSVTDLFLSRFETTAAAQTKLLTKTVS